MELGLAGRVFLVTGGSRGLGLAAASALVDEGARVVVSSRDGEAASAAAAGLAAGHAVGVAADNADPGTAQKLCDRAREAFGRLDGALISVGGPPGGTVAQAPDDAWRAAFESVFLGAVRLARVVAAELSRQPAPAGGDGTAGEGGPAGGGSPAGTGGSIAFVLSSSVRSPIPSLAISNGLRPGLAGVAKALADELGPAGIRVNGLLPGKMATDRVRWLDGQRGDPDEVRAANSREIPLRRYGEPAEFGRVAAFVLSPAASYLTGLMLPVDGGMLRSI
ncbi:MAG: SDR family oxidoreductase [Actinobacteria bacterium]|nr:SDR family oxidoreductase [Actinomycetota bacterium]